MIQYRLQITEERNGRWMIRQNGMPLRTGKKVQSYRYYQDAVDVIRAWQKDLQDKNIEVEVEIERVNG